MKKAYIQTIDDLEIALRHTAWWRFKEMSRLQEEIKHYEKLLKDLNE